MEFCLKGKFSLKNKKHENVSQISLTCVVTYFFLFLFWNNYSFIGNCLKQKSSTFLKQVTSDRTIT